MADKHTLRIGGASAFWGDSNKGVEQLIQRGDVDVLVFDYLAELTLSIMASAKSRNAELGYATDFVKALAPHLKTLRQRGTTLLSNAGGMNPQACAQALRAAADAAGVNLRIAVIEGDDLLPLREEVSAAGVREAFSGAPLPEGLTSMNAYLGAFPIAAALRQGAEVVITGRCADSALALAALVHRFDWKPEDYDRLAAGSLVGHILECTTQTTGGLFTDWWKVPGWEDMGYPIAECEADGTFVLSKPPGTGGLITPLVVSEQMLYEVTDPANYLLPDVTCDFTSVTLEQAGANRVRVRGARGRAPTPTYKVSGTWVDGYRLSTTLTFVGKDAIAMGQRAVDAIVTRARRLMAEAGHGDFKRVCIEVLGSEKPSFGAHARPDAREVVVRLAVHHESSKALELVAIEIAPMGIAGAPGTTGFSGRQKPQAVFRLFSFLWPKSRVGVSVVIDKERNAVEIAPSAAEFVPSDGARFSLQPLPEGETATVPLSAIAVARSGDKGDRAHLAIIARQPRFASIIGTQLTEAAMRSWFEHLAKGPVHRYEVPGIHAYNYVFDEALGGGGAASLRNDPLGKTFSQIALTHPVDIPKAWLPEIEPGFKGTIAS
ncbi:MULTISPECIES: acyclic terpene utilization AtuA family protein [unclassified Variovorax]|uniref:acyclic terpene utilization AtuA family protein n=1 Tax=unclassified Variovorax TaxID=663243 RepID=UPI00076DE5F6|nr:MULTISPECIES: acyclic terpene utilization AtuA family protein [unclassified Variovorax]KWT73930.1 3-hydroxy-3isohexenylglutaryl-CoA:acetate lyase [Variovorax sp. WDL1]PNG52267.1 hypothetical protein CHC07_04639 [Variovorax sp. B4]PNG54807.1 hypothetical protein CHC06_03605 [Variovorax sp. B2]VTV15809.1 hypothetical protein WDL1CHR_06179 [Variovorax sp. WDL1]